MKTRLYFTLTLFIFTTFAFVPLGFAQDERPIVKLIYFLPNDRTPQPDIDEKMEKFIKDVQQFFADQMEAHGFGRKTFLFEADASGKAIVHHVTGRFTDKYYSGLSYTWNIWEEIENRFDMSRNYYFTMIDMSSRSLDSGTVGGRGGAYGNSEGRVLIPAIFNINTAAHELGHAFGLQHDFRDDTYLMSYGGTAIDKLSKCTAEWLDAHQAFNPVQPTTNVRTKFEMLTPSLAAPPNAIRLRFKVSDPDGLHQVQLHTPTLIGRSRGFNELLSCKAINGNTDTTVEFITTDLAPKNRAVSLHVIDINGDFSWSQTYSIDVPSLLPPPKTLSIPDPHLAAAVRQEIGNITTHTILNLTSLNVQNRGITDLTGLEHALNLRTLHLDGEYIHPDYVNSNAVSDISPLAKLTQLKTLRLDGNSIVYVAPLAKLTRLEQLYLNGNSITDVAPLTGLIQLHTLNLDNNSISNVAPLASLTKLKYLWLHNNSITDITPLTGLTKLEQLSLSSNSITDVAPLTGLIQLQWLSLNNNSITDVAPLAKLTQLKSLWLHFNSISDISPLVGLNLTGPGGDNPGLYLWGNPLSYVSINTHIPTMQAKGIVVAFSNRTPTTLTKISGDVQEGFVNTALLLPCVVEVRDQYNNVFAGVPVTFTITNGDGKLNTATASTDTNGRAQAQLTLGQTAGKTTIQITVPEISNSVTFTATASGPNTVAALPDANLRAKITEALGKQPDETLTVGDLLTLTELTANDASIQDLTGVQFARNLTTLSLNNNDISDISPLGTLTQLTTLSLDNNNLSEVIPLMELPELKTLHLRGNILDYPSLRTRIPALETGGTTVSVTPRTPASITKTSGTEGTAGAPHRVSVEVRDEQGLGFAGVPVTFTVTDGGGSLSSSNVVTDSTGAAGTTFTLGATPGENSLSVSAAEVLQPISITITAIDANTPVAIPDANLRAKIVETLGKPHGTDLTAGDMLALWQFQVPNANIRDLTGLDYAHNLSYLNLNENSIDDVAPLAKLTQLSTLWLYNNSITDVAPLAKLTQLSTLWLYNNSITDITPLTRLTKLEQLHLGSNSITDIAPLAKLTQLKSLWLYNNSITDVAPLTRLTQLKQLHLGSNSITDVAPLTGLTQLEQLYLSNIGITDVAPLARLTQLKQLHLSNNSITDIAPLAKLTQLTYLNLGYNHIVDVAPLAKLTQLKSLHLHYNNISDITPLVDLNLTGTEWDNTGVYLWRNPLSYVSINTHIPAMQAKGIVLKFDNVPHPAILKISGDEQEVEAGQTLASPLIVEIQDENGQPMQGVTVKFSIEAGTGKLNPTTTKTDADGKAHTTFTLGTPGTSIIRATVTGIKAYVQFTATTTAVQNRVPTDVNGDGVVDVTDLVLVASDFGAEPVPGALPDTDVNDDGKINSEDVFLVLKVLEETTAAPALDTQQTAMSLQQWIAEAKKHNTGDATFQRGIAVLERLLTTLLPKETALLVNYPNPFNPETWIPYKLAKTAEVTLTIYAINGTVVRTLTLGHQEAGHYQNRSRAAYWDGKNELGEPVASGVYFYTLTAGEFSATRKMLIRK